MKKNLFFVFTMLCALSFFTACSDDDDNKTDDGWKAISEKSCLLLLENSKGNQGNRTKNYYSGSPLFFHENFANQPSYYHFWLLAVVTQYIKV